MDKKKSLAWKLGWQAYWQGISYRRNPFPSFLPQHKEWREGWMAAGDEEHSKRGR